MNKTVIWVLLRRRRNRKAPPLRFFGLDAGDSKTFIESFRRGLTELGYVEDKNFIIDYRSTEGKP